MVYNILAYINWCIVTCRVHIQGYTQFCNFMYKLYTIQIRN